MLKAIAAGPLAYLFALLAVGTALGLSLLIRPVIAPVPAVLFYAVIVLVAWWSRIGPAIVAAVASVVLIELYLLEPYGSFAIDAESISRAFMLLAVAVGFVLVSLARSRAQRAANKSGEFVRVTLASIGDAVIATDAQGTITFMNEVAASVTGWQSGDALGRPLTEVFRIISEETRVVVDSPFELVMREGHVVGLANHTLLIRRDETEVPIEDSGAPIRDEDGVIGGVVLVFRDASEQRAIDRERERLLAAEVQARRRAELAQRRFEYLATASEVLSSSLDYRRTLSRAVELVVPHLADWAAIDMVEDGEIRRLAVAHMDPSKVDWAWKLQEKYPVAMDAPTGVPAVIRTGRSEFYPELPASLLEEIAIDDEHLEIIRQIGFTSAMVVPIRVREDVVGAITLVSAESGRIFEQSDLALAEELARRASLAIENARLYDELAGQRDQLDAILRGASDGIVAHDAAGELVFVNDAAAKAAGYASADAMLAEPPGAVLARFTVHDAEGRELDLSRLPFRRAIEERQIVSELLRFTAKADGQERWLTMTSSPVPSGSEIVRFVISIMHDVTRMKRTQEQLRRRADQQQAVAALGERALVGSSVDDVIEEALRTVAETLDVEMVKVLELLPERQELLVRNGIGWNSGIVGRTLVPATQESQAGFTLAQRHTVVAENLGTETRFQGAGILHDHGVRSGMTVRIGSQQNPFGILGAHSVRERMFSPDDAVFMETVANILASSIGRRRSEHALEQQREWLRVTISSIGDAVIATDTEGRITLINPVARRLTGWAGDEALGRPLTDVFRTVNEQTGEATANPAIRALAEGTIVGLANHTLLVSRDGRQLPIDDSAAPIRDRNGMTIGVVLVFHDVTDQRLTEQSLRESEERFRNLADSAPVQIWMSRPDGFRTYFNRTWLKFSGRTLDEEVGTGWIDRIHPDDRAAYLSECDAALRENRRFRSELRLRRADGEFRWLLDTGTPRLLPDGTRAGLIGSCIDISDLKQIERELTEAKVQAESASAAKDQFLAVLSHELRTPLTPVLTLIQYLESADTAPEEIRSIYEMIRRNIELEARLIDDLLDLTRITRGKLHLDIDMVDAHSLLRNAVEICREDISAKELDVSVALSASAHTVAADPARLQQVFWNLIQNAVKFTPERGRIAIHSDNPEPDRIAFQIRDTGIGMEPDQLERVFNPFEQAERTISRRFGGLGLGLSISSSIVEMLGGTLTAESKGRDHGSTFVVTLATANAEGATRRSDPAPAATDAGAPLRILLVDDHADTSSVMKLLLERRGYRVKTEANVADALDTLAREQFDLLISDIGLPDGSGLDLMRKVRERTTLAGIALSGFGMEEDVRRSRDAGFSEHLTKPVNFQILQEAIRRVLG